VFHPAYFFFSVVMASAVAAARKRAREDGEAVPLPPHEIVRAIFQELFDVHGPVLQRVALPTGWRFKVELRSAAALRQLSRAWRAWVDDQAIWRVLYLQMFPPSPHDPTVCEVERPSDSKPRTLRRLPPGAEDLAFYELLQRGALGMQTRVLSQEGSWRFRANHLQGRPGEADARAALQRATFQRKCLGVARHLVILAILNRVYGLPNDSLATLREALLHRGDLVRSRDLPKRDGLHWT
jgi:hypothetical protein